jgi:hypothetical protein
MKRLIPVLLTLVAACGTESAPTPVTPEPPPAPVVPLFAAVSVTGPTDVDGRAEGNTFRCSYEVQLTATGSEGSEGVWATVRRTMVTTRGGHWVSDTVSGKELASLVGTDRIRPGQTLRAQLLSGFIFPSNSVENAADGAHEATWDILYLTGGELRSTQYTMRCHEPAPPAGPPAGRYALVSINGTPVPAWGRSFQIAADTLEFYADTTYSGRAYPISSTSGQYLSVTARRKYQILSRDTLALQRVGGAEVGAQRVVRKGTSLVYVDSMGWPAIRWRYDPVAGPASVSHMAQMPLLPLVPRIP